MVLHEIAKIRKNRKEMDFIFSLAMRIKLFIHPNNSNIVTLYYKIVKFRDVVRIFLVETLKQ